MVSSEVNLDRICLPTWSKVQLTFKPCDCKYTKHIQLHVAHWFQSWGRQPALCPVRGSAPHTCTLISFLTFNSHPQHQRWQKFWSIKTMCLHSPGVFYSDRGSRVESSCPELCTDKGRISFWEECYNYKVHPEGHLAHNEGLCFKIAL